jgi:hypothetical protein
MALGWQQRDERDERAKKQFADTSANGTNPAIRALAILEDTMATNKPTGDNARKGAVKKRSQLKNPLTKTSTKRNKKGGQFMAVKKTAKKFKGVRREKAA